VHISLVIPRFARIGAKEDRRLVQALFYQLAVAGEGYDDSRAEVLETVSSLADSSFFVDWRSA